MVDQNKIKLLMIVFAMFFAKILQANDNNIAAVKSIAVVLKLNGNGHRIDDIGIVLQKIFDGKINTEYDKGSLMSDDYLRVNARDQKGNLLYEGYFDNPLSERKESFEENGVIPVNDIVNTTSGSINVRFPVTVHPDNITLTFYQNNLDQTEKLIKTLALNQK